MRIFVGLAIPEEIRRKIADYADSWKRVVPSAKWVNPASYHVTLKFIGEKSEQQVGEIKRALAAIQAPQLDLSFRGTGFFPTPRSPRVFWIGIHAGEHLANLARLVDETCSRFGIAREGNEYHPHLTLARPGSGSPRPKPAEHASSSLRNIADQLHGVPEPDFGTMTAREFILFESKLSPRGAHYSGLAQFPLLASQM